MRWRRRRIWRSRRRDGCRASGPSASPARRAIRRSVRSFGHAGTVSELSLTRALRAAGALTPALLLRSLLGGERELFAEALAELSGLPPPRVAAFILDPQGEGFAALAHKAGLKSGVLPAVPRGARRHQDSRRRRWRRAQTVAGAKGHRRMRTARQSRARQGSGAAMALRRRGGEGGSRGLRARGGCLRFPRPAAANPGLLSR